jgi:hypothetical protein
MLAGLPVAAWLAVATHVRAEEPEDVGSALVPAPAEVAPMRTWSRVRGLPADTLFTGLASADGLLLAGDVSGNVYRSFDDGAHWRRVLGAGVEAAREREAGDEGEEPVAAASVASGHARPWISAADPSLVLVGRDDGTWRSLDGGETWSHVDDPSGAHDFLPVGSVIVAGSDAGLRVSPDRGERWIDILDVTEGAAVLSLAMEEGVLYAGGLAGLFRSEDGLRWTKVALPAAEVYALLADPSWTGGLWAVTDAGVLRTDDGARSFYRSGSQPLSGTRGLHYGVGELLAFGSEGAWRSVDAGVTWTPLVDGLEAPGAAAMALHSGQVFLAGDGGVYRLRSSLGEGGLGAVGGFARVRPTPPPGPSSVELLGMAAGRHGLDVDALAIARKLAWLRYAPSLSLVGIYGWTATRSNDWSAQATTDAYDNGFVVATQLCWGLCQGLYSPGGSDYQERYEAGDLDVDDLYDLGLDEDEVGEVTGAEVESFSIETAPLDDGIPVVEATSVARSMRTYRDVVFGVLTGTYADRARLLAEPPAPGAGLRVQVEHALALAEAEARLDIYTDGGFGRAVATLPATSTEN